MMEPFRSDMRVSKEEYDRLHEKYSGMTKARLIDLAEQAGGLRSSVMRSSSTTKPMLIDLIIAFFGADRELG